MRRLFTSIIIISSILMFVAGCKGQENDGQAQVKNSEILADGSEVVVDSTNENNLDWLMDKQNELKKLVADQLKITEESISITLSEISDGELSLSIVLDVKQEIDRQSVQELTDNMINTISKQGNMNIQQENIAVFDSGNNLLN